MPASAGVLGFPGVHLRVSERADGDFHLEQPTGALEATRRRFVDLPWSQPDEVHGVGVGSVTVAGEHDGIEFDALVTDLSGVVLGIWVGDCAPVGFAVEHHLPDGSLVRIGAAHAGWRGLLDGVLERTVATLRDPPGAGRRSGDAADSAVPADVDGGGVDVGVADGGGGRGAGAGAATVSPIVTAVLGPCIHPCCYEFGQDELARFVDRFGPAVVGRTRDGRPALDMPTAVRVALDELGVALDDRSACTGCSADRWFSHRVRRERGRQVMAVWKDADMGTTGSNDAST